MNTIKNLNTTQIKLLIQLVNNRISQDPKNIELELAYTPILTELESAINGEKHIPEQVRSQVNIERLSINAPIAKPTKSVSHKIRKKKVMKPIPKWAAVVAAASTFRKGEKGLAMVLSDEFGTPSAVIRGVLSSQGQFVEEMRALPEGEARFKYLKRVYGWAGGDSNVTIGDHLKAKGNK
jgi:hypothetical protein